MANYLYQCTNSKECHYSETVSIPINDEQPEILKDCPTQVVKQKKDGSFTEKKCKGKLKKKITGGAGFIFK